MVQPQLVVNESFRLQGLIEGDASDAAFDYYTGMSIFAAEQLLIKISKADPQFMALSEDYIAHSRSLYPIISPALLDFVEINRLDDGRVFVVSENNNYQFLESFLRKGPQLLLEHICRYVIELGQALNAFHRHNLVYGCLDAKSILIHALEDRIDEIKVQKAAYGPFMGNILREGYADFSTLVYVAPEMLNRKEGVVQSDFYSIGIHLFKFLTGNYPIPKESSLSHGISLKHVARALVRRNVPQELILLILKCLRFDPLLRPHDVVEILSPLRLFIDERRTRAIEVEGIDPLAVLDSLNMGRQRQNAQEVVRILDTADYFKSLAFTTTEANQNKKPLQYPLKNFKYPEQIAATELQEALGPHDDPGMSPEDYVNEALEIVAKEEFSQLTDPMGAPIRRSYLKSSSTTVCEADSHTLIEPIKIQDEKDDAYTTQEIKPIPNRIIDTREEEGIAKKVLWKSYRVTPDEIIISLQRAKSRAQRSRGTLSFIEEPSPGSVALRLNREIFQCREGSLYADIGAIPKNATMKQILMALLYALIPALMNESKKSLQFMKRRLGTLGYSQLVQIDYVSPGYHGIFFKDIADMDIPVEKAIELIRVFCRRKKPLFIVMRNVEHLGKDGNALLMALKDAIPKLPIITLGFFKSRQVESWHILSRFDFHV